MPSPVTSDGPTKRRGVLPAGPANVEFPPVTHWVRGVFKGGGAKGIVYCGALYELRARGMWFDSVAGASAGAITAVLVAAGFSPTDILELADIALTKIRPNLVSWVLNRDRALYKVNELKIWLESRLKTQLGADPAAPALTFQEFQRLSRLKWKKAAIELNVIAHDLARKEPILFSARTTPDFSVSEAVIASSAIPVAMPSRRVEVRSKVGREIHRLMDGGTYSNYPAFVYKDASFRAFFDLDPIADPERVLGFVIDDKPYVADDAAAIESPVANMPASLTEKIRPAALRRSRFDRGGARNLGIIGSVATSAFLRWSIGFFGALALGALTTALWIGFASTGAHFAAWVPTWADPILLPFGYILVVGVDLLALAIACLTVRVLPEAIEVGLPAVLAMLSVGPSVPRWVGKADDDHVVRLSAPLGINIVKFRPTPESRRLAIRLAGDQASAQLATEFPTSTRDVGVPPLAAVLPPLKGSRTDARAYLDQIAQLKKRLAGETRLNKWSVALVVATPFVLPLIASTSTEGPGIAALALLLGAPFLVALGLQVVRGRIYNYSFGIDYPEHRPILGSLFVGPFLVVLGYVLISSDNGWMLNWSFDSGRNSAIDYTYLAMAVLTGLILIATVAARMIANAEEARYRKELGLNPPIHFDTVERWKAGPPPNPGPPPNFE